VPRHPPPRTFPGPDRPACSAHLFDNLELLGCFALIIGEGHATFRAGTIGGRGRAVGGAWRRSAGFDSSNCPVVLWLILGVPGQHLALNLLHVVNFIQLLHGAGVPVQEVKPGIDHGILSLPEGRHSEEACQTGDHHLGHAWNFRQSNALAAGPRCVIWCPSAPGESANAA
jgi:hypothetical protein